MGVLGEGSGSDYPTAIDTAEQQTDGASGTLADANWANDVTSALTAIEGELGTDPAGTLSTVAARLVTLIAAGGGITAGTTANRPTAAAGTYRLYWNTTLNRLELIKDDASVTAIAGVTDHGGLTGLPDDDHTQYGLVAGSRNYTGDTTIEKASPALRLKGTETSAKDVRWYEDAGTLYLQEYTGGVWNSRWSIGIGTGNFTNTGSFKTPTLIDSGSANAWDIRSWASDVIADKWGLRPSSLAEFSIGLGTGRETNDTYYTADTPFVVPYPFWALQLRNTNSIGTSVVLRANINAKVNNAGNTWSARLKITYTDGTVEYSNVQTGNNTAYAAEGTYPLNYTLSKNDSVESISVAVEFKCSNAATYTATIKSDTTYLQLV